LRTDIKYAAGKRLLLPSVRRMSQKQCQQLQNSISPIAMAQQQAYLSAALL
jgi:hypothetical protein